MKTTATVLLAAAAFAAAGCASAGGESADPAKGGTEQAAAADPWKGSGFSVWDLNGAWWVFLEGSKDLASSLPGLQKGAEPEKRVTRIGAGPGGVTLKAPDSETLDAFDAWRPGFSVRTKDGRVWIFKEKAKELAEFDKGGAPEKRVTRIGAGPRGQTLVATDGETLDAWASAK